MSRHSRARLAIPWGFLGMLVLVGSIERSMIHGHLALCNLDCVNWSHAARQLKRAAPGRDILCFGDSQVKHGIIPRVLQERTGRAAYNLAVLCGSAPSSYFLLRRAYDSGARPSIIIVDFAWGLFQRNPGAKECAFLWPALVNLRESVELCWAARDPDLLTRITLDRLLPSLRSRFEIRTFIRASLMSENPKRFLIALQHYRNLNRNDGAMIYGKTPFQNVPAPPPTARVTGTWRPDRANLHFLRKFLALAERQQVRVIWLIPPVSPGLLAHWEFSGNEEMFETFVRSHLKRHANLLVLDARHAGYDASVFHDLVHLDCEGAQSLSDAVANLLSGRGLDLTAPARWIALPAYRKPASKIPLEDLDQSFAAISRTAY